MNSSTVLTIINLHQIVLLPQVDMDLDLYLVEKEKTMDTVTVSELFHLQTLHLKSKVDEFISISNQVLELRDKEIIALRQQVKELADEACLDLLPVVKLMKTSAKEKAGDELKAVGPTSHTKEGGNMLGKRKGQGS